MTRSTRLRALWLVPALLIPLAAATRPTAPGAAPAPSADTTHATVSISAEGTASVTPDRASISLSVVTRAATAREAGAQNARKQRAVIDAVLATGVARDHISTSGYTLTPEMRYVQNQTPQVAGYTASNTVVVETKSVESVGPVIDAALGAGANQVSSLSFTSSMADSARREAIASAVAEARLDALAAARGAGVPLGALLDLTVSSPMRPQPVMYGRMAMMSAASADTQTPVEAGTQTVHVTVSTRWRLGRD